MNRKYMQDSYKGQVASFIEKAAKLDKKRFTDKDPNKLYKAREPGNLQDKALHRM